MTDVRELVSWLGPRSPHLHPVTGRGGIPELTAQDIAAALAGAPKAAQLAILARYANGSRDDLVEHLHGHTMRVRWRRSWPAGELRRAMAAAVDVFLGGSCCQACRGTGLDRGNAAKPCRRCDGTGRAAPPGRKIADAMGIPESTYRRVWAQRIADAVTLLHRWESTAAMHMSDRLGRRQ